MLNHQALRPSVHGEGEEFICWPLLAFWTLRCKFASWGSNVPTFLGVATAPPGNCQGSESMLTTTFLTSLGMVGEARASITAMVWERQCWSLTLNPGWGRLLWKKSQQRRPNLCTEQEAKTRVVGVGLRKSGEVHKRGVVMCILLGPEFFLCWSLLLRKQEATQFRNNTHLVLGFCNS